MRFSMSRFDDVDVIHHAANIDQNLPFCGYGYSDLAEKGCSRDAVGQFLDT